MPVHFKIELTEEAKQFVADMQTLPARTVQGIARAMDKQNLLTVSHIQKDYLSFPRDEPTNPIGLRHISGDLARHMWASPSVVTPQGIESAIGDNVTSKGVNYAEVHEFGAAIPSRATRSKNKAYARRHPTTKAYSIGERAPVQHGIDDRMGNYSSALSAACTEAWKEKS